jgi:hypothetical protein
MKKTMPTRPDSYHLWTIQTPEVLERVRTEGILYAEPERSEFIAEFPEPFEWVREEMDRRVPGHGGHFPWWAWYCPQPDLRRFSRAHPAGEDLVKIELLVPKSEVLLSAFSAWEMAMGCGYVCLNYPELDAWDQEMERHGINDCNRLPPEPWQATVISTWERIFDIPALEAGGAWSTDWIQATFEALRSEDIVKVTPFRTR